MTERYIADVASFKQTASGEFYGQWEKKMDLPDQYLLINIQRYINLLKQ